MKNFDWTPGFSSKDRGFKSIWRMLHPGINIARDYGALKNVAETGFTTKEQDELSTSQRQQLVNAKAAEDLESGRRRVPRARRLFSRGI